MKKLIQLFILLCATYIILNFLLSLNNKGYTKVYTLTDEERTFEIKEIFSKNIKNEKNHYLFEITVNDIFFPIQVNDRLNHKEIIKQIKYVNDKDYTCIYPIFQNQKMVSDILCQKDEIIYPYQSIVGISSKIDQFAMGLDSKMYEMPQDSHEVIQNQNTTTLYSNLPKGHYLALENYKGIYLANGNNLNSYELFSNDSYNRSIHAFYDRYYITADYTQKFDFHEFYGIDFINGKEFKIISNQAISMNSYIQGVIENSIYLIDRSNKKQYEINLKKKTVKETGSVEKGIQFYENGKWETRKMQLALTEDLLFSEHQVEAQIGTRTYEKVDYINGYYYMYQKTNDSYIVYRSLQEYPESRTYLFTLKNLDKVYYIDDYIYFINDDTIFYYHDGDGIQMVLEDSELGFNNNLFFGVIAQ